MRKKRLLALVRAMHAGGGVTLNVASLLRNIARHTDWQVVLISAPLAGEPPLELEPTDGFDVRMLKTRKAPASLDGVFGGWPVGFKEALREVLPEVDLVHHHSLWRYPTRVGCPIIRRAGKPYLIAPRGTLHPWALSHRKWRKRVAWRLHERRNLAAAACLQATSAAEAAHFRDLGLKNPIAVIPHGVHEAALNAFEAAFANGEVAPPSARRKRRLLCVSRLHPIKRIKELAAAWAAVADRFPDWELTLVGDGDPRYKAEIRQALAANPAAEQRTVFEGYLTGDALWRAYLEADLLALVSHSENFGSVAVEALAAQTPVIATQGTPWSELERRGCGWWIGMRQADLEQALERALGQSDEQRIEMGRRGREWACEHFSWPKIAKQTAQLYDWIRQECPRADAPAFVNFVQE